MERLKKSLVEKVPRLYESSVFKSSLPWVTKTKIKIAKLKKKEKTSVILNTYKNNVMEIWCVDSFPQEFGIDCLGDFRVLRLNDDK